MATGRIALSGPLWSSIILSLIINSRVDANDPITQFARPNQPCNPERDVLIMENRASSPAAFLRCVATGMPGIGYWQQQYCPANMIFDFVSQTCRYADAEGSATATAAAAAPDYQTALNIAILNNTCAHGEQCIGGTVCDPVERRCLCPFGTVANLETLSCVNDASADAQRPQRLVSTAATVAQAGTVPPGGNCANGEHCAGGSFCMTAVGMCLCPNELESYEGKCVHPRMAKDRLPKVPLGAACGNMVSCDHGSHCVSGVCQCVAPAVQHQGRCVEYVRPPAAATPNRKVVGPGDLCDKGEICGKGSICDARIPVCVCPPGTDLDNGNCVAVRGTYAALNTFAPKQNGKMFPEAQQFARYGSMSAPATTAEKPTYIYGSTQFANPYHQTLQYPTVAVVPVPSSPIGQAPIGSQPPAATGTQRANPYQLMTNKRLAVGAQCSLNAECPTDAYCNGNTQPPSCQCLSTHLEIGGRCEKIIYPGQTGCNDDRQCSAGYPLSRCLNRQCVCPMGSKAVEQTCVPVPLAVGDVCDLSLKERPCPPGSACIDSSCQCRPPLVAFEQKCLSRGEIHLPDNATLNCVTESDCPYGFVCSAEGECDCSDGFHRWDGKCWASNGPDGGDAGFALERNSIGSGANSAEVGNPKTAKGTTEPFMAPTGIPAVLPTLIPNEMIKSMKSEEFMSQPVAAISTNSVGNEITVENAAELGKRIAQQTAKIIEDGKLSGSDGMPNGQMAGQPNGQSNMQPNGHLNIQLTVKPSGQLPNGQLNGQTNSQPASQMAGQSNSPASAQPSPQPNPQPVNPLPTPQPSHQLNIQPIPQHNSPPNPHSHAESLQQFANRFTKPTDSIPKAQPTPPLKPNLNVRRLEPTDVDPTNWIRLNLGEKLAASLIGGHSKSKLDGFGDQKAHPNGFGGEKPSPGEFSAQPNGFGPQPPPGAANDPASRLTAAIFQQIIQNVPGLQASLAARPIAYGTHAAATTSAPPTESEEMVHLYEKMHRMLTSGRSWGDLLGRRIATPAPAAERRHRKPVDLIAEPKSEEETPPSAFAITADPRDQPTAAAQPSPTAELAALFANGGTTPPWDKVVETLMRMNLTAIDGDVAATASSHDPVPDTTDESIDAEATTVPVDEDADFGAFVVPLDDSKKRHRDPTAQSATAETTTIPPNPSVFSGELDEDGELEEEEEGTDLERMNEAEQSAEAEKSNGNEKPESQWMGSFRVEGDSANFGHRKLKISKIGTERHGKVEEANSEAPAQRNSENSVKSESKGSDPKSAAESAAQPSATAPQPTATSQPALTISAISPTSPPKLPIGAIARLRSPSYRTTRFRRSSDPSSNGQTVNIRDRGEGCAAGDICLRGSSCVNGKCACPDGFVEKEDACIRRPMKPLGSACIASLDQCAAGARCRRSLCVCVDGAVESATKRRCRQRLGGRCSNGEHCIGGGKCSATSRRCECPRGQRISADGQNCEQKSAAKSSGTKPDGKSPKRAVPAAKSPPATANSTKTATPTKKSAAKAAQSPPIGSECKSTAKCGSGSVCRGAGRCECDSKGGFVAKNGKCVRVKRMNATTAKPANPKISAEAKTLESKKSEPKSPKKPNPNPNISSNGHNLPSKGSNQPATPPAAPRRPPSPRESPPRAPPPPKNSPPIPPPPPIPLAVELNPQMIPQPIGLPRRKALDPPPLSLPTPPPPEADRLSPPTATASSDSPKPKSPANPLPLANSNLIAAQMASRFARPPKRPAVKPAKKGAKMRKLVRPLIQTAKPGEQCGSGEACTGGSMCRSGVCMCADEETIIEEKCVSSDGEAIQTLERISQSQPGQLCTEDTTCTGGAVCSHNICACPEGTSIFRGECLGKPRDFEGIKSHGELFSAKMAATAVEPVTKVVVPGAMCRLSLECPYRTECIRGVCRCRRGESIVNGVCRRAIHEVPPGGRCDTQKGLDCVGESHCFYGICVCLYGLVNMGNECASGEVLRPVEVGGACDLGQACEGGAQCLDSVCQCGPDEQLDEQGRCVNAEASTIASRLSSHRNDRETLIYGNGNPLPVGGVNDENGGRFNQILTAKQMSINVVDLETLKALVSGQFVKNGNAGDQTNMVASGNGFQINANGMTGYGNGFANGYQNGNGNYGTVGSANGPPNSPNAIVPERCEQFCGGGGAGVARCVHGVCECADGRYNDADGLCNPDQQSQSSATNSQTSDEVHGSISAPSGYGSVPTHGPQPSDMVQPTTQDHLLELQQRQNGGGGPYLPHPLPVLPTIGGGLAGGPSFYQLPYQQPNPNVPYVPGTPYVPGAPGTQCSSGSYCYGGSSCVNGVCTCRPGYRPINGQCQVARVGLGEQCHLNEQCDPNGLCQQGVCSCGRNTPQQSNQLGPQQRFTRCPERPTARPGEDCSQMQVCAYNSVCGAYSGVCECPLGMETTILRGAGECVPTRRSRGVVCVASANCHSNAYCDNGYCMCKSGYVPDGDYCVTQTQAAVSGGDADGSGGNGYSQNSIGQQPYDQNQLNGYGNAYGQSFGQNPQSYGSAMGNAQFGGQNPMYGAQNYGPNGMQNYGMNTQNYGSSMQSYGPGGQYNGGYATPQFGLPQYGPPLPGGANPGSAGPPPAQMGPPVGPLMPPGALAGPPMPLRGQPPPQMHPAAAPAAASAKDGAEKPVFPAAVFPADGRSRMSQHSPPRPAAAAKTPKSEERRPSKWNAERIMAKEMENSNPEATRATFRRKSWPEPERSRPNPENPKSDDGNRRADSERAEKRRHVAESRRPDSENSESRRPAAESRRSADQRRSVGSKRRLASHRAIPGESCSPEWPCGGGADCVFGFCKCPDGWRVNSELRCVRKGRKRASGSWLADDDAKSNGDADGKPKSNGSADAKDPNSALDSNGKLESNLTEKSEGNGNPSRSVRSNWMEAGGQRGNSDLENLAAFSNSTLNDDLMAEMMTSAQPDSPLESGDFAKSNPNSMRFPNMAAKSSISNQKASAPTFLFPLDSCDLQDRCGGGSDCRHHPTMGAVCLCPLTRPHLLGGQCVRIPAELRILPVGAECGQPQTSCGNGSQCSGKRCECSGERVEREALCVRESRPGDSCLSGEFCVRGAKCRLDVGACVCPEGWKARADGCDPPKGGNQTADNRDDRQTVPEPSAKPLEASQSSGSLVIAEKFSGNPQIAEKFNPKPKTSQPEHRDPEEIIPQPSDIPNPSKYGSTQRVEVSKRSPVDRPDSAHSREGGDPRGQAFHRHRNAIMGPHFERNDENGPQRRTEEPNQPTRRIDEPARSPPNAKTLTVGGRCADSAARCPPGSHCSDGRCRCDSGFAEIYSFCIRADRVRRPGDRCTPEAVCGFGSWCLGGECRCLNRNPVVEGKCGPQGVLEKNRRENIGKNTELRISGKSEGPVGYGKHPDEQKTILQSKAKLGDEVLRSIGSLRTPQRPDYPTNDHPDLPAQSQSQPTPPNAENSHLDPTTEFSSPNFHQQPMDRPSILPEPQLGFGKPENHQIQSNGQLPAHSQSAALNDAHNRADDFGWNYPTDANFDGIAPNSAEFEADAEPTHHSAYLSPEVFMQLQSQQRNGHYGEGSDERMVIGNRREDAKNSNGHREDKISPNYRREEKIGDRAEEKADSDRRDDRLLPNDRKPEDLESDRTVNPKAPEAETKKPTTRRRHPASHRIKSQIADRSPKSAELYPNAAAKSHEVFPQSLVIGHGYPVAEVSARGAGGAEPGPTGAWPDVEAVLRAGAESLEKAQPTTLAGLNAMARRRVEERPPPAEELNILGIPLPNLAALGNSLVPNLMVELPGIENRREGNGISTNSLIDNERILPKPIEAIGLPILPSNPMEAAGFGLPDQRALPPMPLPLPLNPLPSPLGVGIPLNPNDPRFRSSTSFPSAPAVFPTAPAPFPTAPTAFPGAPAAPTPFSSGAAAQKGLQQHIRVYRLAHSCASSAECPPGAHCAFSRCFCNSAPLTNRTAAAASTCSRDSDCMEPLKCLSGRCVCIQEAGGPETAAAALRRRFHGKLSGVAPIKSKAKLGADGRPLNGHSELPGSGIPTGRRVDAEQSVVKPLEAVEARGKTFNGRGRVKLTANGLQPVGIGSHSSEIKSERTKTENSNPQSRKIETSAPRSRIVTPTPNPKSPIPQRPHRIKALPTTTPKSRRADIVLPHPSRRRVPTTPPPPERIPGAFCDLFSRCTVDAECRNGRCVCIDPKKQIVLRNGRSACEFVHRAALRSLRPHSGKWAGERRASSTSMPVNLAAGQRCEFSAQCKRGLLCVDGFCSCERADGEEGCPTDADDKPIPRSSVGEETPAPTTQPSTTLPAGVPPGSSCARGEQCSGGAICHRDWCVCPDPLMVIMNGECTMRASSAVTPPAGMGAARQVATQQPATAQLSTLVAPGQMCGPLDVCAGGSVCVANYCLCPAGMEPTAEGQCVQKAANAVGTNPGVETVSGVGAQLTNSASAAPPDEDECTRSGLFCHGGTICVDGGCQCPPNSELINDQCIRADGLSSGGGAPKSAISPKIGNPKTQSSVGNSAAAGKSTGSQPKPPHSKTIHPNVPKTHPNPNSAPKPKSHSTATPKPPTPHSAAHNSTASADPSQLPSQDPEPANELDAERAIGCAAASSGYGTANSLQLPVAYSQPYAQQPAGYGAAYYPPYASYGSYGSPYAYSNFYGFSSPQPAATGYGAPASPYIQTVAAYPSGYSANPFHQNGGYGSRRDPLTIGIGQTVATIQSAEENAEATSHLCGRAFRRFGPREVAYARPTESCARDEVCTGGSICQAKTVCVCPASKPQLRNHICSSGDEPAGPSPWACDPQFRCPENAFCDGRECKCVQGYERNGEICSPVVKAAGSQPLPVAPQPSLPDTNRESLSAASANNVSPPSQHSPPRSPATAAPQQPMTSAGYAAATSGFSGQPAQYSSAADLTTGQPNPKNGHPGGQYGHQVPAGMQPAHQAASSAQPNAQAAGQVHQTAQPHSPAAAAVYTTQPVRSSSQMGHSSAHSTQSTHPPIHSALPGAHGATATSYYGSSYGKPNGFVGIRPNGYGTAAYGQMGGQGGFPAQGNEPMSPQGPTYGPQGQPAAPQSQQPQPQLSAHSSGHYPQPNGGATAPPAFTQSPLTPKPTPNGYMMAHATTAPPHQSATANFGQNSMPVHLGANLMAAGHQHSAQMASGHQNLQPVASGHQNAFPVGSGSQHQYPLGAGHPIPAAPLQPLVHSVPQTERMEISGGQNPFSPQYPQQQFLSQFHGATTQQAASASSRNPLPTAAPNFGSIPATGIRSLASGGYPAAFGHLTVNSQHLGATGGQSLTQSGHPAAPTVHSALPLANQSSPPAAQPAATSNAKVEPATDPIALIQQISREHLAHQLSQLPQRIAHRSAEAVSPKKEVGISTGLLRVHPAAAPKSQSNSASAEIQRHRAAHDPADSPHPIMARATPRISGPKITRTKPKEKKVASMDRVAVCPAGNDPLREDGGRLRLCNGLEPNCPPKSYCYVTGVASADYNCCSVP